MGTPQPDYATVQNVPKNVAQLKAFQRRKDSVGAQNNIKLANSLSMKIEKKKLAGVTVRTLTPSEIDQDFSESVFVHLHGGAYVLSAGNAGITEAILIAHRIKITVISVDYRMPPDHPYPAALDDAVAV